MEKTTKARQDPAVRSPFATVAALAIAAAAFLAMPGTASAQVAAADIPQFMGTWDIPLDAQGQPFDITLVVVEADDGSAAATVEDMLQTGVADAETVGLNGDMLEVEYMSSYQGTTFPVVVRLIPTDDAMDAEVELADGQMFMDGTATRVE